MVRDLAEGREATGMDFWCESHQMSMRFKFLGWKDGREEYQAYCPLCETAVSTQERNTT